jgi:predicted cupin superfamily sugar epimerase
MDKATYWVQHLGLKPHPEGGFFKETYRSTIKEEFRGFSAKRNLSTGIYFLLEQGNFSAFHRIKSDEMWHFYAGDPLVVHMIDDGGKYHKQLIGPKLDEGQALQFVVPAGVWFASEVADQGKYSLVGCTVSPGFDFDDFELADKNFETKFPEHRNVIQKLVR